MIIKKIVRFRCTIDVDVEIPHSWTKEEIESSDAAHQTVWGAIISPHELLASEKIDYQHFEYVGVVDDTPRRELRDSEQTQQQSRTVEKPAPKPVTYKELDETGCGTADCPHDHSTLFLHCPNCLERDSELLSVRYEKEFKEIRVACEHCEIDIVHVFIAPGVNFEFEDYD